MLLLIARFDYLQLDAQLSAEQLLIRNSVKRMGKTMP